MTEKYNGWENRETWVVALWVNNEQDLYNECRAIVKRNDRFKARDMIEDMLEGLYQADIDILTGRSTPRLAMMRFFASLPSSSRR